MARTQKAWAGIDATQKKEGRLLAPLVSVQRLEPVRLHPRREFVVVVLGLGLLLVLLLHRLLADGVATANLLVGLALDGRQTVIAFFQNGGRLVADAHALHDGEQVSLNLRVVVVVKTAERLIPLHADKVALLGITQRTQHLASHLADVAGRDLTDRLNPLFEEVLGGVSLVALHGFFQMLRTALDALAGDEVEHGGDCRAEASVVEEVVGLLLLTRHHSGARTQDAVLPDVAEEGEQQGVVSLLDVVPFEVDFSDVGFPRLLVERGLLALVGLLLFVAVVGHGLCVYLGWCVGGKG